MDRKRLKLGETMVEIPIERKIEVDEQEIFFKKLLNDIVDIARFYAEIPPKTEENRLNMVKTLEMKMLELKENARDW